MESEALGTPVIASSLGGIPELIEDNKTGEIIKDLTIDNLVNNITSTYQNKQLLKNMSQNCIKKRNDFISIEKYCKELEKIYQKFA